MTSVEKALKRQALQAETVAEAPCAFAATAADTTVFPAGKPAFRADQERNASRRPLLRFGAGDCTGARFRPDERRRGRDGAGPIQARRG
jgi:hypothetical protein